MTCLNSQLYCCSKKQSSTLISYQFLVPPKAITVANLIYVHQKDISYLGKPYKNFKTIFFMKIFVLRADQSCLLYCGYKVLYFGCSVFLQPKSIVYVSRCGGFSKSTTGAQQRQAEALVCQDLLCTGRLMSSRWLSMHLSLRC